MKTFQLKLEKTSLLLLALSGACLAQVPQGVTASLYEPSAPELQAYVNWQSVTGASGYKIYEYGSVGQPCPTVDSAYVYDDTVTESWYLDDPNLGWYAISAQNLAAWQRRWWCYEVTSVTSNGTESARSQPAQVAIGSSGYITLQYETACHNGNIVPFPYTFDQMQIHLYYRDAYNADHEFDYAKNSGPTFAEVEWKIPEIAKDGSVVPLVAQTGYNGYWYSWKAPDMAVATSDNFLPVYGPDSVSYSQINIRRVQHGPDCPMPWERPGADYVWHQNVTR